ncbi:hypothetical protein [Komagataeibacter xylinus]|uniref:hypothetical protein n=1 Tax=Komagataeibacter xylinus TaxID=28448 RepID=UPI00280B4276|nr:hypothetical protein [Komagataeibacter xylinus]
MLSADRVLKYKMGPVAVEFAQPVAAGCSVFRGSITAVCQDGTLVQAGAAAPPSPMVGILGIAQHQQINTAGAPGTDAFYGGGTVRCRKGTWALPFDVAPTWADFDKPVYAVDDETVSLTQTPEGGTARLLVGTLCGLDADGTPYVEI